MKARETKQPAVGDLDATLRVLKHMKAAAAEDRPEILPALSWISVWVRAVRSVVAADDSRKARKPRKTAFACSALVGALGEFTDGRGRVKQCRVIGTIDAGKTLRMVSSAPPAMVECRRCVGTGEGLWFESKDGHCGYCRDCGGTGEIAASNLRQSPTDGTERLPRE